MTAMPMPLPTVNTDAWRAWRRHGLGASDYAVLMDLDPNVTQRELALEKRGLIERPEATDVMTLGHEIEDVVAARYARDKGCKLQRFTKPVVSDRWPHAFADPDRRVLGTKELVEIKWRGLGWDEPPERVEIQALVQMGMTGAEAVHVATLDAWGRMGLHTVARRESAIEDLLGMGEEWFAKNVLGDDLPPEDGSKGSRRYIDSIPGSGLLDAQSGRLPDMDRLMAELRQVRLEKDGLEKEDARLIGLLVAAMAGHDEAVGDSWRIAWKRTKPSSKTDWKLVAAAFRKALPADVDAAVIEELYTLTGDGSRPFRPTWS